jgi:hypothetical protein
MSQARVKNWPNTIEALRYKRQEEKMKKLEDDEVGVTLYFIYISMKIDR